MFAPSCISVRPINGAITPVIAHYEDNNESLGKGDNPALRQGESITGRIDFSLVYEGPDGNIYKNEWGGSGGVIGYQDGKKLVLTADHVVSPNLPPDKILQKKVSISGVEGEVIYTGQKADMDYAIVAFPDSLPLLTINDVDKVSIGNSDTLERGDFLYSIGYPLLIGKGVSTGEVNITEFEEDSGIPDYFFTYTSETVPGNSGGLLYAVKEGKLYVVGITVAHFTRAQDIRIGIRINDILEDFRSNGGKL